MSDLSILTEDIEKKINKLVDINNTLKGRSEELEAENQELLKLKFEYEKKIKELNEQNKLLQIAKSIKTAEGKTEIKLRINELVREIDNCIALLNR